MSTDKTEKLIETFKAEAISTLAKTNLVPPLFFYTVKGEMKVFHPDMETEEGRTKLFSLMQDVSNRKEVFVFISEIWALRNTVNPKLLELNKSPNDRMEILMINIYHHYMGDRVFQYPVIRDSDNRVVIDPTIEWIELKTDTED